MIQRQRDILLGFFRGAFGLLANWKSYIKQSKFYVFLWKTLRLSGLFSGDKGDNTDDVSE